MQGVLRHAANSRCPQIYELLGKGSVGLERILWRTTDLIIEGKTMAQVTLNLDGEALREATVQAMLGVLSPETKAKVLESAIQKLLQPSTDSWDKKKSPIEIAFENAVLQVANIEAKRMVEEDSATRERMNQLLRITADKILDADMDKLAQRMADAFVASIRRD
jgi:hypothetical protein